MSIYIYSGAIRSGKTTAVQLWCNSQKNIGGILMPDMNGKRKIVDISSGTVFDLECDDPGNSREALLHVGRFFFYENTFQKANAILLETAKLDPEWLVIDELGKLELSGKGFYMPAKKIIDDQVNKKNTGNVLLVIREKLCEELVSFFNIKEYRLILKLKGTIY